MGLKLLRKSKLLFQFMTEENKTSHTLLKYKVRRMNYNLLKIENWIRKLWLRIRII